MAKERVYLEVRYDHIREMFTTELRPLAYLRKMCGSPADREGMATLASWLDEGTKSGDYVELRDCVIVRLK